MEWNGLWESCKCGVEECVKLMNPTITSTASNSGDEEDSGGKRGVGKSCGDNGAVTRPYH